MWATQYLSCVQCHSHFHPESALILHDKRLQSSPPCSQYQRSHTRYFDGYHVWINIDNGPLRGLVWIQWPHIRQHMQRHILGTFVPFQLCCQGTAPRVLVSIIAHNCNAGQSVCVNLDPAESTRVCSVRIRHKSEAGQASSHKANRALIFPAIPILGAETSR